MRRPKTHLCDSCGAIVLTKRRFCDERCRHINEAKKVSLQTYRGKVARVCQRMIRAEHGAQPEGYYPAIRRGVIAPIYKCIGECVCVTCGRVDQWNHKGIHAGHWISRSHQSVLFEEDNLHPQCDACNEHGHGMPHEYRQWMVSVMGIEVIERLETLKRQAVTFDREQLVDMRIEFSCRLKAAIESMKGM